MLDSIYKNQERTLIAISWGPDSMYVADIVQTYREYKERDKKELYYIYCDHSTRKENQDKKIITQHIDKKKLHITKRTDKNKYTEASLRKRRYNEIQKYAHNNNINILITGHHLSDRIESTILHLLRWASIDWFLSMRQVENNSPVFHGKIVRPLLRDNKSYIQAQCDKYQVPYTIDPSNNNLKTSKRNVIRHNILQPLRELSHKNNKETSSFEESMQQIYDRCEKNYQQENINLKPIARYTIRESDRAYKRETDRKIITHKQIKQICQTLHIWQNMTKKWIIELYNFLQTKKSGHKYINKTYWFISHDNIYIIKWPKKFREKKYNTKIDRLEHIFVEPLIEKPKDGERYIAQEEEKIHGKKLKKRCINQKIPIFRRTNIVLYKQKWNIKAFIPKVKS